MGSAWRTWCCCMSFASSGHGCQGHVCCCKVKTGRPTAIPDSHEFWKDNDKCDCNLICCGLQSRTNVAPITSAAPPQAYTAPAAQQIPPNTHGHHHHHPTPVAAPTVGQNPPNFADPVKPGTTGYPGVQ